MISEKIRLVDLVIVPISASKFIDFQTLLSFTTCDDSSIFIGVREGNAENNFGMYYNLL